MSLIYSLSLRIAEGSQPVFLPPRPNLVGIKFVGCGKCQAQWTESTILRILHQLYDPSVAKDISISGTLWNLDGVLGLDLRESGNVELGEDLLSYMLRSILRGLDVTVRYVSSLDYRY